MDRRVVLVVMLVMMSVMMAAFGGGSLAWRRSEAERDIAATSASVILRNIVLSSEHCPTRRKAHRRRDAQAFRGPRAHDAGCAECRLNGGVSLASEIVGPALMPAPALTTAQ